MKLREKTTATLLIAIFMISAMAAVSVMAKKGGATIQDGTIVASTGEVITVGYDVFGYNYQAHMFNGLYDDYDRVHGGAYPNVHLIMKWNDAWLSNMDYDGDNLLDRHFGFPTYKDSGAWLTNHQYGVNPDGTLWDYFVKIVAVRSTDVLIGGVWCAVDGTVIGPAIWGPFAIIQQVDNDPYLGLQGIQLNTPSPTGFGYYK